MSDDRATRQDDLDSFAKGPIGGSPSGEAAGNNEMSLGAGMGGTVSYEPNSPISTSVDDSGPDTPEGSVGDRVDATQGSTGGRQPRQG